ncbi:MAG: hypothetical protein AAFW98_17610 [Pseudomonadota bacterium]
MRDPRRAALGVLFELLGEPAFAATDLAPIAAFDEVERRVFSRQLAKGINSPKTSSMGRLFDAVAALCGFTRPMSYEGEAALLLQVAGERATPVPPYSFALLPGDDGLIVDWAPALTQIIADLRAGSTIETVAYGFQAGLAKLVANMAITLGESRLALTGGCFQNRFLSELVIAELRLAGVEPLWHEQVPPNDGGLALGQALWAARLQGRRSTDVLSHSG